MGIRAYLNEGSRYFPRGDNNHIAQRKNILQNHWTNFNQIWHIVFLGEGNFSNEGPCPFRRKDNDKIAKNTKKIKRTWHAYNTLQCRDIIGNPRGILIDSLFHRPWVHLVTFACFQSNMHDHCDPFLLNETTCYVCVLLFSFGFSE